MQRYDYNLVRLQAYIEFFDGFFRNAFEWSTATMLLTDVRFAEVAKAFTMRLTRVAADGLIRPLHEDVAGILRRCAEQAFGTDAHDQLPSWFLQNYEGFLASCTHKLLRHYARNPTNERSMQSAYGALLQMADGMKQFVGLKTVRSGAHALMAACHHSRSNFLAMECNDICVAHLCFVEQLAGEILQEPERSMHDRHNSLSFFAKSVRWQQVVTACTPWLPKDSNLSKLQLLYLRGAQTRATV